MNDNEASGESLAAGKGNWNTLDPIIWMPFRDALKRAYDIMSIDGEQDGNVETSIAALSNRIFDGLIRFEVNRSERMAQYPSYSPEFRTFNAEDRAAFLEFMHSACQGHEEKYRVFGGRPWSVVRFEPFSGDFKFQMENNSPPWTLSYAVWGLMLAREDVDTCWPPSPSSEASKETIATTALAEMECRQWLIEAFAADAGKLRARPSFQEEALEQFAGRLSVRGFLRVWGTVAPIYRRNTPGRKS
jgi:hypothetical protein